MADSIDLIDKSGSELTFSWFIDPDWDGGSWHTIMSLEGNSGPEDVWHHETVDLSSYLVSDFKIRFRAKVSASNEDGNVDDVKIVTT